MKNLVVLIAFVVAPRLCFGQIVLSGSIINVADSSTIESAVILVKSGLSEYTTVSNRMGHYHLTLSQPGVYQLTVQHVAFVTYYAELVINESREHPIQLSSANTYMGAAVINGVRAEKDAAITYTDLEKADIQKMDQGKDMPFLLNLTPSTVISSDAGNGVGYTGIRIRGVDPTRVNVTINGIPLNDGESQGVYWVNLPDLASSAQSIQVQRGIGTSTNGVAAFGASVNIRTLDIPKEKFARADLGFGSFNTFRSTFAFGSGQLKNNWSFLGRGSVLQSDGFIDRASSDLKSLNFIAEHQAKKGVFKTNILIGSERTYQAWWGIPQPKFEHNKPELNRYINELWIGGADLENLQNSNSKTYNYYQFENEVDNYNQNHYQFFYDYTLSKRSRISTAAYITTGEGYFEQHRTNERFEDYGISPYVISNDTFESGDLVRRRWLDNVLVGVLANYTYTHKNLNLNSGVAFSDYRNRHFGEVISTDYTAYEALNVIYYDNDASKSDANAFVKLNYKAKRWKPFVDLQVRAIQYAFEGLENNAEFGNQSVSYTFFNPKVGASRIGKKAILYAFYAIGNREPVRDDFRNNKPNDWPKHEQLKNLELGYKYTFKRKQFAINIYDMQYVNQLVLTGAVNDVGEAVRTNVDNSYRRGIELEGQLSVRKSWQVGGNLTLSENKIESFTEYVQEWDGAFGTVEHVHEQTDIAFSPNRIAAAIVSYKPNKSVQITLTGKHVGKQYLDNTQNDTRSLDAFSNLDLALIYAPQKRPEGMKSITAGFYLNNVLNAFYAPNGYTFSGYINGTRSDFNYVYPMAGRNVMLKTSLTF